MSLEAVIYTQGMMLRNVKHAHSGETRTTTFCLENL